MATAIPFQTRPLSYKAVFQDRRGTAASAKKPSSPNVIQFPAIMPREVQLEAQAYIRTAVQQLREQSARYEASAEQSPDPYPYVNLFAMGPLSLTLPEPKQKEEEEEPELRLPPPLFAGDWAMLLALAWMNPRSSQGGGLPATTVLGDRPWRMQFSTLNRSQMLPGSGKTFTGEFPSTAPDVLVRAWSFVVPDPGPEPALFEANATFTVGVGARMLGGYSQWCEVDAGLAASGLAPFDQGPLKNPCHNFTYMVTRKPKAIGKKGVRSLQ